MPVSKSSGNRPPALIPAEPEVPDLEISEDPEGRSDWFFSQRAYPSGDLPADARESAWELVSRGRILTQSITTMANNTWQSIGPSPTQPGYSNWGLTSGRINAVAVSPANAQIVLAGSSTGGIWQSTNAGASFAPVTDSQVDLAVGSIAFSPSNPSIVYAGMGDSKLGYLGSGVLKSTNGGRAWNKVSNNTLPSPGAVARIEVDPANPDRVYVAQYLKVSEEKILSSGFYLSTDGGVSWTRTLAGAARDIAISPANRQTLFTGIIPRSEEQENLATPGLHRSTDGGNTWTNILPVSYDTSFRRDVRVAVTPARPQNVYVFTGGITFNGVSVRVAVSTDNGDTWSDRSTSFDTAQIGYNSYLYVDPRNADTLYLGSRDVYRSTNGGASWSNLTRSFSIGPENVYLYTPAIATTHPDQHAFALSPTNQNDIYIGNDGGLSKSTDRGATFQSLNATLSLTQFVGIAVHPTDPRISYGGTQDNGTQVRLTDSNRWFEFAPGDGGRCVINPENPSQVFTNYYQGNLYRFNDNGRSYDRQIAFTDYFGEFGDRPRIGFYPPFVGNGVDSTIYIGTYRLFMSTSQGGSWFAPGGGTDLTKGINEKGVDVLSAIAVSRSNTNIIYTGSAQGRAMLTTDAGATWSDITRSLPDRFITSIAVDPNVSAKAYLSVSGFKTSHIFKTTDGGASWAAASAGLPDIPVNALLIDPFDSEKIYAGTDIGVFRSRDGGASWQSFNNGMPPVVITGFAAQASGLIQVATYGRGAFEIRSGDDRPSISSASFDGKKKLSISGARFGSAPKVLINGVDQSGRISSFSDTSIKLKSKASKLGLKTGDNVIQVIESEGNGSNVFILRL
ncbi:MAG TPA: hypothetical protein VKA70_03620 [Blastocatellia bacterium]|nr:hypothetical protein [Blastocatellia bacterium]